MNGLGRGMALAMAMAMALAMAVAMAMAMSIGKASGLQASRLGVVCMNTVLAYSWVAMIG